MYYIIRPHPPRCKSAKLFNPSDRTKSKDKPISLCCASGHRNSIGTASQSLRFVIAWVWTFLMPVHTLRAVPVSSPSITASSGQNKTEVCRKLAIGNNHGPGIAAPTATLRTQMWWWAFMKQDNHKSSIKSKSIDESMTSAIKSCLVKLRKVCQHLHVRVLCTYYIYTDVGIWFVFVCGCHFQTGKRKKNIRANSYVY